MGDAFRVARVCTDVHACLARVCVCVQVRVRARVRVCMGALIQCPRAMTPITRTGILYQLDFRTVIL